MALFLGGCGASGADRIDTAQADASECGLVTTNAHSDPRALIAEFIRRNSAGEFQRSTEWFAAAVDCPNHEPGPDVVSEITGFRLSYLEEAPDSVRAEVIWNRVRFVSAVGSEEAVGLEHDTLTAVRTPFGWRIRSPALRPRAPAPTPSR